MDTAAKSSLGNIAEKPTLSKTRDLRKVGKM